MITWLKTDIDGLDRPYPTCLVGQAAIQKGKTPAPLGSAPERDRSSAAASDGGAGSGTGDAVQPAILPPAASHDDRTAAIRFDALPHPDTWDEGWIRRVSHLNAADLCTIHQQYASEAALLLPKVRDTDEVHRGMGIPS